MIKGKIITGITWAKKSPKKSIGLFFLLCILGYWGVGLFSSDEGEIRYVVGTVERGTLVSSISGTGQVSASSQVDLKPKAGGDVVYVSVLGSQEVKAGALVAQLDSREAQKAVRDAEVSLLSAKLSLQKLEQPADQLSLIQSQNTLAKAEESKIKAEETLLKEYEDGFTAVSNAFTDLPDLISGLQTLFFTLNPSLSQNEQPIDFYASAVQQFDDRGKSFRDDAYTKYQAARVAYDKNFFSYKQIDRSAPTSTIEVLISETYTTSKLISDALKSGNNLIQFYNDTLTARNLAPKSAATSQLSTISTYTSRANTHISLLLEARTSIENEKSTIVNATRTIIESSESLKKLKTGTDVLDLESSRLTVKQRENALLDAKETLANYFVRAAFDGTIAKINVRKGDSVTSGTAIATLITKQKLAEISLNEVDVAKVKVGQNVTLTFDAVEELTITGKVAEIDTVGTVSQGVVTYTVKINFDTDDERVKPGMSVSAAIIVDVKQNVLLVPNSAIKSQGNNSTVEVFSPALSGAEGTQGTVSNTPPTGVPVVIGASNDTSTEILSGVEEGTQVVTRTITGASGTAQTTAPSIFSAAGVRTPGTGGGGGTRAVGF